MFISFAAAIGAFVASTVLSSAPLQGVMRHSEDIYANALPSVVWFAALREQVHRVDDELSEAVDAKRPDAPGLAGAIGRLQADTSWEPMGLPSPPAEPLTKAAASVVAAVLAGAERARARLGEGDIEGARAVLDREVRPAVETADATLQHSVDGKAGEAVRAARRIASLGTDITALSVGLDVACVVLTAFLATAAIRAVRRHTTLIEGRSRELEQFAARVAHDLRGPLTPVQFALQRAGKQATPDDPMHGTLARANRSLARMTALVDDLLSFARAGGAPDPDASADVHSTIDAVLDEAAPAAQASGIALQCEPGDEVRAACAAGVLQSLLSNLVRNAIKYMGEVSERRVVVRWHATGNRVRVEVADTGPGLPSGTESAVFEPYVRADRTGKAGIGLGLATVKRLAEAHGGAAGVASSPRGCTFWFALPKRDARQNIVPSST
jgi:signal transduction histidine kinase